MAVNVTTVIITMIFLGSIAGYIGMVALQVSRYGWESRVGVWGYRYVAASMKIIILLPFLLMVGFIALLAMVIS